MNETQTKPLDLLTAEQRVEALLVALADCAEFRRWLLAMPQILSAAYEIRWLNDRSEFDCVVKGLRAFREDLIRLAALDELSEPPLSHEAIHAIVERFQRAMLRQAQSDTTIRLKSAINGVHVNGVLPPETSSPALQFIFDTNRLQYIQKKVLLLMRRFCIPIRLIIRFSILESLNLFFFKSQRAREAR